VLIAWHLTIVIATTVPSRAVAPCARNRSEILAIERASPVDLGARTQDSPRLGMGQNEDLASR
jgi:hypothetical protein